MPTPCTSYLDTACDACDATCSCPRGPGTDETCALHGDLSNHAAEVRPEREHADGSALTR